jgi:hypothetical protein
MLLAGRLSSSRDVNRHSSIDVQCHYRHDSRFAARHGLLARKPQLDSPCGLPTGNVASEIQREIEDVGELPDSVAEDNDLEVMCLGLACTRLNIAGKP